MKWFFFKKDGKLDFLVMMWHSLELLRFSSRSEQKFFQDSCHYGNFWIVGMLDVERLRFEPGPGNYFMELWEIFRHGDLKDFDTKPKKFSIGLKITWSYYDLNRMQKPPCLKSIKPSLHGLHLAIEEFTLVERQWLTGKKIAFKECS